jgi:hypothetical protein
MLIRIKLSVCGAHTVGWPPYLYLQNSHLVSQLSLFLVPVGSLNELIPILILKCVKLAVWFLVYFEAAMERLLEYRHLIFSPNGIIRRNVSPCTFVDVFLPRGEATT